MQSGWALCWMIFDNFGRYRRYPICFIKWRWCSFFDVFLRFFFISNFWTYVWFVFLRIFNYMWRDCFILSYTSNYGSNVKLLLKFVVYVVLVCLSVVYVFRLWVFSIYRRTLWLELFFLVFLKLIMHRYLYR